MPIVLRLAAGAVFAVLIALMVGPFQNVEAATNIWDKAAHFVAFGVILLCLGALMPRRPRIGLAIAAVAVGGLVEIVQGLTGRDASWGDLLADALGAAAVLLIWGGLRHFDARTAAKAQTSNSR